MIILLCCPDVPNNSDAKQEKAVSEKKKRTSYPPVIYVMCVLLALIGLLISPLLIGCSFLSANIDPSATIAGIVAVCFSLGCMVSGLEYPTLAKKLGRYCFTCFLLVAAVGAAGSALADNIPLYIGAAVFVIAAVFFGIYNPFAGNGKKEEAAE